METITAKLDRLYGDVTVAREAEDRAYHAMRCELPGLGIIVMERLAPEQRRVVDEHRVAYEHRRALEQERRDLVEATT
ncbi:MAG: hypothetical protein QOC60_1564 [Frankiaceae bacterium]|jgi:hypothetical protein|nr:hypothetical protein [Frankiaceae bacterium]